MKRIVIHLLAEADVHHVLAWLTDRGDLPSGTLVAVEDDAPALVETVVLQIDAGTFVADANEATEAVARLDAALARLRGKMV